MEASKALDPVEFRFTDPSDVDLYGDRWYLYDESALIRMRARDLIDLEAELGMPLVEAMNGMRMHSTLGDLAATWLSVRAVDPDLAGNFEDFNPVTMLVTWRPAANEGKDEGTTETEDPPATPPQPANGYHSGYPSRLPTSDQTDSVVLQTSPVVE